MTSIPELVMRVALPPAGSFACCPSGDTAYEEAWQGTIDAALPASYEVVYPRLNRRWPVDADGLTWVTIKPKGDNEVQYWMQRAQAAEELLEVIRHLVIKKGV